MVWRRMVVALRRGRMAKYLASQAFRNIRGVLMVLRVSSMRMLYAREAIVDEIVELCL